MNPGSPRATFARYAPLLLIPAALAIAACGSSNNSSAAAPTKAPSAAVPVATSATGAATAAATRAATAGATSTTAPAATSAAAATGAPAGPEKVSVDIKDIAFPDSISVKPGTTVTWINKDGFPHTVTANPGQAEAFDSKNLDAGATFSFTFTKAGTYTYFCNYHETMHGKVVVGDQATGVSTPAPQATQEAPRYPY